MISLTHHKKRFVYLSIFNILSNRRTWAYLLLSMMCASQPNLQPQALPECMCISMTAASHIRRPWRRPQDRHGRFSERRFGYWGVAGHFSMPPPSRRQRVAVLPCSAPRSCDVRSLAAAAEHFFKCEHKLTGRDAAFGAGNNADHLCNLGQGKQ